VRDLPHSSHDAVINRAIIAMAHSLGFKVIAEGIEDDAQQAWLAAEGCDEGQGYRIARPMPAAEFGEWLQHAGARSPV
jgi:EAL domain-containing protein (putative c-di-GMP-specific phosphodiesterase class I)